MIRTAALAILFATSIVTHASEQAAAKARCGVRYLDGFGDVIKPDQKEAHARLSTYAAQYNQRMLAHCPPVDGKP